MYKGKQIYKKGKEKKKIFRISAGVFPRHAFFKTIPKMAAVLDTPLEKLITQAVCPLKIENGSIPLHRALLFKETNKVLTES